jgi:hypothetical protein
MQTELSTLKLKSLPRSARPRCNELTKQNRPCQGQALSTGKCYLHSGFPRGVSPEGQARQAAAASGRMKAVWASWREHKALSPEARR